MTFTGGQQLRHLELVIRGDRVAEPTEQLRVEIVSVTGATAGSAATVTIRDDDRGRPDPDCDYDHDDDD